MGFKTQDPGLLSGDLELTFNTIGSAGGLL